MRRLRKKLIAKSKSLKAIHLKLRLKNKEQNNYLINIEKLSQQIRSIRKQQETLKEKIKERCETLNNLLNNKDQNADSFEEIRELTEKQNMLLKSQNTLTSYEKQSKELKIKTAAIQKIIQYLKDENNQLIQGVINRNNKRDIPTQSIQIKRGNNSKEKSNELEPKHSYEEEVILQGLIDIKNKGILILKSN